MSPTRETEAEPQELSVITPSGTMLDNLPGERLTREEIRFRVLRRAFQDLDFQVQLLTNTRVILSIAYDECLGIDRNEFLGAILSYPVLYETPNRLYMEIPGCHRGCTLPDALPPTNGPRKECGICERAFPLPPGAAFVKPAESRSLTRRTIEGHIQKRVAWDSAFAAALNSRPLETYTSYATELCSGRYPRYLTGITELELVHETNSEMFFIFPTWENFQRELDC